MAPARLVSKKGGSAFHNTYIKSMLPHALSISEAGYSWRLDLDPDFSQDPGFSAFLKTKKIKKDPMTSKLEGGGVKL